jgi:hypothetical protein
MAEILTIRRVELQGCIVVTILKSMSHVCVVCSGRSSQVRLLAGAVVRKRPADCSAQDASNKKPCTNIKGLLHSYS